MRCCYLILQVECGGIALWAIFLHLPLENKLSDGFVWNANPILLRRVELAPSTPTKKNRQPQGLSVLFLVEVWRFELQASSTRSDF